MPDDDQQPYGTVPVDGVVNRRSPLPAAETVGRLSQAIVGAGAMIFAVIDQRHEAARAGLVLRETTLLVFGNPAAGTPLMQAAPLSALDLPLKILVWADDQGATWMTYLAPHWLADRYGLGESQVGALRAVDAVTEAVSRSAA